MAIVVTQEVHESTRDRALSATVEAGSWSDASMMVCVLEVAGGFLLPLPTDPTDPTTEGGSVRLVLDAWVRGHRERHVVDVPLAGNVISSAPDVQP